MLRPSRLLRALVLLSVIGFPARAPALTIAINAGAGLAGNAAAVAAWGRAADQWEAVFTDPVTVSIDADLSVLPPGILGSTGSVTLFGGYDLLRDLIVFDALDEAGDGIVASLPTASEFFGIVPDPSFFIVDGLAGTKANLKALGVPDLDALFGVTDATVAFNSDFAFDFDNSDGVGAGLFDFETIAAHEIGHALGFTSSVDVTDDFLAGGGGCLGLPLSCILMHNLDLFRFGDFANPSTPSEFTTFARDLRPGVPAYFDDLSNEWAFSTGAFTGDGNQASHWKADELSGAFIGLMDPTLAPGVIELVDAPDVRALDVIGWDFEEMEPVPEPGTLLLLGAGLSALGVRRWASRARPTRSP